MEHVSPSDRLQLELRQALTELLGEPSARQQLGTLDALYGRLARIGGQFTDNREDGLPAQASVG